MRQLTLLECHLDAVAGAGTITYAPALAGHEIIGWEQTFLYWDITQTVEDSADGFTSTVHITKIPVYDIDPIYSRI